MAKLIVNPTSASRREILLPRSVLSIGRDPSNDLVLPDAMVSRRHAVVEFRGSQYFIRDCNSSNGSLVNGDRVSERSLRDGDLVAIGTARLLFRDDLEIEEVSSKVVQHPSSPRLVCPSCSSDYRKGDLFCRQCGASLAPAPPAKVVCAACGTAVPLPARFCNACGHALPVEDAASAPPPPAPPASSPAASGGAAPAAALSEPESLVAASQLEPIAQIEVKEAEPAPEAEPLPAPGRDPERSEEARVRPIEPRPLSAPAVHRPAAVLSSPLWQRRPAAPQKHGARSTPAGFGARLVAGLVDAALVSVLDSILIVPVFWYWWEREVPRDPSQVPFLPILLSIGAMPIAALVVATYFVYGWGQKGATLGKRLFGLVVEGRDGAYPIGAGRALVRLLGYAASGLTLGLGFLMIALVGEGLHDKIAGTRVVRREGD
jgi:uncharacterized RDD family membrane protein YckC